MKRLLIAAILAGLSFTPRTGRAQTIVLGTALTRDQPTRGIAPEWINLADCLADDVLRFQVMLTGFAGLTLDVWAGADGVDCKPPEQRQGDAAQCWLVQRMAATAQIMSVPVRAQDLVARVLPSAGTGLPHSGTEACRSPLEVETNLTFMLISSGTLISGAPQIWTLTGFDTDPPPPPDTLEVESGPAELRLSWTGTPASDVLGFQASCERPSKDPAPQEMLDDVCQSDLLPGAPSHSHYWCGSLVEGTNEKSTTLTGLESGELYAAAVSAVDRVGNTGPLSPVACATPGGEPPKATSKATPKISRDSGCGCSTVAQHGSLHVVWLLAGLGVLVGRRAGGGGHRPGPRANTGPRIYRYFRGE